MRRAQMDVTGTGASVGRDRVVLNARCGRDNTSVKPGDATYSWAAARRQLRLVRRYIAAQAGLDGVRVELPLRLRDVAEQQGEDLPGPVLAAVDLLLRDEDPVVGVIGDDVLEVLGTQRLRQMSRNARRRPLRFAVLGIARIWRNPTRSSQCWYWR